MKLYYSADRCSTSCHIALEESGLAYEAIEVNSMDPNDPVTVLTRKLNPMTTLPVFVIDDQRWLDQVMSIHLYVAEQAPDRDLFPIGGFERIEAMNWFSFVASDLHKAIGGLYIPGAYENGAVVQSPTRDFLLFRARRALNALNVRLRDREFITGSGFTGVDAYAYMCVRFTRYGELSVSEYPEVLRLIAQVEARPAVKRVLEAERLVPFCKMATTYTSNFDKK